MILKTINALQTILIQMTLIAFVIGNSHHVTMNSPLVNRRSWTNALKTVPIKENV